MKGQVALVTGGSGYLGAAICARLGSQGAHVVVHYHSGAEAAERVVAEISAQGGSASAIRADVTNPAEIEEMVQSIHKEHEQIDILVNNAGITRDTLFVRMSEADWDAVMDTNLKSAFLCSKAVVRNMLRARYGASSMSLQSPGSWVPRVRRTTPPPKQGCGALPARSHARWQRET